MEDGIGRVAVQIARRLIRHNNGRVVGQGAGNGGALLLPARNGGGEFVRLLRHVHLFQQVHRSLHPLAGGIHVAKVHRQHNVFDDGQRGQKLEELEDNAHVTAAPFRHLPLAEGVDGGLADNHLPFGGAVYARYHVDEGGFAASRFAHHGHKFAGVDL